MLIASVNILSSAAQPVLQTVSIEYVAHACFLITTPSNERLLIDPFASRVWIGYDYPAEIEADTVLITHPHYDHDGGVSVGHSPSWSETTNLWREPGTYPVNGATIHGVAGKHADPYGKEFGQTNTIWVVEVAGIRIAHLGDNGPLSNTAAKEIGKVDILMMPADADFHILKKHEVQPILDQLSPSLIIPMHYRHADLEPENGPSGLGGIDGWLVDRPRVRRLSTNQLVVSQSDLPDEQEILVFRHSSLLTKPQDVE